MSSGSNDRGFTMIELIISLGVLGLLVGGLTTSLILGFRATQESSDQVNEAVWGRIASNWFTTDVHAASSASTNPATSACGDVPHASLLATFSSPRDPNFQVPPPPHDEDAFPGEPLREIRDHAEWWFSSTAGEVLRVECATETFYPTPGPGPAPDPVVPEFAMIAKGLASAAIACEPLDCTVSWVVPETAAAEGRADRDYFLRVGRRAVVAP